MGVYHMPSIRCGSALRSTHDVVTTPSLFSLSTFYYYFIVFSFLYILFEFYWKLRVVQTQDAPFFFRSSFYSYQRMHEHVNEDPWNELTEDHMTSSPATFFVQVHHHFVWRISVQDLFLVRTDFVSFFILFYFNSSYLWQFPTRPTLYPKAGW